MNVMKDLALFALAVAAMWMVMVAMVDAYDFDCQQSEDQARKIVSYGVVR